MASKKTRPPAEPSESPSFEEALERLETVVEELEAGSLTLEQSIARYEEGVKLSRRLGQTLDAAEKRIERLVEAENGPPATEPLELDADEAEDEDSPPPPGTARRGGGSEELPF